MCHICPNCGTKYNSTNYGIFLHAMVYFYMPSLTKLFSTNYGIFLHAKFGLMWNEIVIIHIQVILNCQMSNVQFTNFVLITNS